MKGEETIVRGAVVFLIAFAVFLVATLGYPNVPPGKVLYQLLGVPETTYPVLGVPATLLVEAIINGVIYGTIAWLIFSLTMKTKKAQSPQS